LRTTKRPKRKAMGVRQLSLDELKAEMRERKPVHQKRHARKYKKAAKKRKRTIRAAPRELDMDYHEKRREELKYYMDRSDLTGRQIAKTLGLNQWWVDAARNKRIMRPNDFRVSVIIDFVKDYERLQTYYSALLK